MNLLIRKVKQYLKHQKRIWCHWLPVGYVRFGSLRRITPISKTFGFGRGKPIDRYYIEDFLKLYAEDVHGHILEIGDDTYTKRFGKGRVIKSDVLHITSDNPKATIVADLTCVGSIPSNSFDCIILTQTLQFIYDFRSALNHIFRILKPNGVVLATLSGISQISRYDMERWGEYWRFTPLSAKKLFEGFFPPENIATKAFGNVLSAAALLYGLASEELKEKELNYQGPDYPVIIGVRAVKPK